MADFPINFTFTPNKTSQIENDSNYLNSENIKAGSGISVTVSEDKKDVTITNIGGGGGGGVDSYTKQESDNKYATKTSLSDYAKKTEIPTKLPNPNALIINGTSYDGSKEVEIEIQGGGSTENAVLYTAQSLTEEQKAQARANIGAGTGGGSVDGAVLYNTQDLTDEQMQQASLNIGVPNIDYKGTWVKGTISSSGVISDHENRAYCSISPVPIQINRPTDYWCLHILYYDEDENLLLREDFSTYVKDIDYFPVQQIGHSIKIVMVSSPTKVLTDDDLAVLRNTVNFRQKLYSVTEDRKPTISREFRVTRSLQLKCAMEVQSTGFQNTTPYYLWYEEETQRFFVSHDHKGYKEFVFQWSLADTPDYWSMAFLAKGDILCVYNSAMSETPRTIDPVVLERKTGYQPRTVLLSTGTPKPYGWFANHGFTMNTIANDTIGEYFIAEYTRTNTDKCYLWKIDGYATSKSSWKIVKEYTLSGNDYTGMKHFHGVQVDPFTGYIYSFTGDDSTSSFVLVSKDEGVTFTEAYGPDETRCRLLNYVFTEDYVYWGTDSAIEGRRLFFRAVRDAEGVIDIANAEILYTFSDLETYAVYGTVYVETENCIVILLRSDGITTLDCPVYVWDLTTNTMKTAGYIKSQADGGGSTGFRCRYYERTPKTNTFAVSWDITNQFNFAFMNPNKILNSRYNQIYTLLLTVSRIGDSFNISYDTVR